MLEELTNIILNSYGGDACPLCGYGAFWGTLYRNNKGQLVRSEYEIAAAKKLAKCIMQKLKL